MSVDVAAVADEIRRLAAELRSVKSALDWQAHEFARQGHDACAEPIDGPVDLLRALHEDLMHQANRLAPGSDEETA